jgi:bla regulator protein BlaR1
MFTQRRRLPSLAGVLEDKSQLKRRITMITKFKENSQQWSILAGVLVILLGCVALTDARAEQAGQVDANDILTEADLPAGSVIDANGRIVDKIDYPFENDPCAIGGWRAVDLVKYVDKFTPGVKSCKGDLFLKELFIMEGGRTNLAFSWTKGLILHYGDRTASEYYIEEIDGDKYMFLEVKSGDYVFRHMKPRYYVLVKDDRLAYVETKTEDKIDYPFVDDPNVIGTWVSVDFVDGIEKFKPGEKQWKGDLYLKQMVMQPDGKMDNSSSTWTKGLILNPDMKTASRYLLQNMEGSTYMFFEWKSGDYTARQMYPKYYVLKLESSNK